MIYGLKTKDGRKLYAVGSWEQNQHKVYNDYTKALNELDDAYMSGDDARIERAEAWRERAELEMDWVDNVMQDGLIYAPWEVRNLIKGVCAAYDAHSDYLLDEILEADGERKKTLSDVLDCFDHSSISRGLDTHKDD